MAEQRHMQFVKMGLGDAIKRLIQVEFQFRTGTGDADVLEERRLLLEAMNSIPLHIEFHCDSSDVSSSVAIFQEAASTSCCRLMPFTSSRSLPPNTAQEGQRSRRGGGSRSTLVTPKSPLPTESSAPALIVEPNAATPPPADNSGKKKGFLDIFRGK